MNEDPDLSGESVDMSFLFFTFGSGFSTGFQAIPSIGVEYSYTQQYAMFDVNIEYLATQLGITLSSFWESLVDLIVESNTALYEFAEQHQDAIDYADGNKDSPDTPSCQFIRGALYNQEG